MPSRNRRLGALAAIVTVPLVLSLAACSTSSAAGSSSSSDTTKLTLGLNYIAQAEHFGPYYAEKEGLYSKQGLDVDIQQGTETPSVQLLLAGKIDVAVSDGIELLQTNEKAGSKKADQIVAIGTEFQNSPYAVTCRADSGITKASQIVGKTVGVKAGSEKFLPVLLTALGIKESDITVQAVTGTSEIIAGKVDCMMTTFITNEPKSIEDAGVKVNAFLLSDLGFAYPADTYVTTRENLADPKKKKALEEFIKATAQAWKVGVEKPDYAAKYMVDNAWTAGLQLSQQKYQAETQADLIADDYTKANGLLTIDTDALQDAATQAKTLGLIDSVPTVTDEVDDLAKSVGTPKI